MVDWIDGHPITAWLLFDLVRHRNRLRILADHLETLRQVDAEARAAGPQPGVCL